jgi:hypothetical protein
VALVGDRTQYLNLDQIEKVCEQVGQRVLASDGRLIELLRRELTTVSANGLRSGALGQGLFGPHAPRPGLVAITGPGGVGKSYFAELLARVLYGERFGDHLIVVNCRAYFAGRFPPLPRAKLEAGPLAILSLDGVEVLPEIPPVAALWTDAIRYGRAAFPATTEQGTVTQVELSFARCLVVATANVARELVYHIGFRPPDGRLVGQAESAQLIREALNSLFEHALAEVFPPDQWAVLPPLDRAGMRRLVDLQIAALGELLPKGSPPVELDEAAARAVVEQALRSKSPNKTAALVDLVRSTAVPAIDTALLRAGAPLPLRARITADAGAIRTQVEPVQR